MSSSSAYFNLTIAAAGAGLLSYPYAVQQQGVFLCIGLTLFFAGFTVYTDYIIVSTGRLFRHALPSTNFDTLMLYSYSPAMGKLASASIVIGSFGALIGYLIVIGDLLCAPLLDHFQCSAASSPTCFFVSRPFIIPTVAFTVTLPLSALEIVEKLGHSSILATVTVIAVCLIVSIKGVEAASKGGYTLLPAVTHHSSLDTPTQVVLSRWTFDIFLGIPIAIFSLGNHMQILPVYLGAKEGSPEQRRFPWVVVGAVTTCVVLYLSTGVLGYMAYTSTTAGDVMSNLPNDALTITGKVLLAIHLLLAFPVLFFPARSTLIAGAAHAAHSLGGGEGVWTGVLSRALLFASRSALVIPFLVTGSAALLAVAAPKVTVVFGLLGATVATFQIYTCPGLLLLKWATALESSSNSAAASGGKADTEGAVDHADGSPDPGAVLSLEAVERIRTETWGKLSEGGSSSRSSSSSSSIGSGGEGEGGDTQALLGGGGGEGGKANTPTLLYFSSPTALRAMGYALLLTSVIVGVIGTVTYCTSTWG